MITIRAIFDQPSLKYSVKILFHHQRLLVIVMMLSFTEDVWEFQNYQIAPEFLKRKVGLQKWRTEEHRVGKACKSWWSP